MWRFLIPGVLFVVLAGFLYKGLYSDPRAIPSPLIGKPAPTFSLPRLEDPQQSIGTAQLAGKMYVLNVWATWCGACLQEHPTLMALAGTGVVPFVGLNWKETNPDKARQFLSQRGNPYIATASDSDGRVAIDWGVYGAPETFLVGADGKVLFKHVAPMTPEVWEKEFLKRINEARKEGGAGGKS